MSDNWVVQNLENALETWNDKLSEIWQLLTTTPQDFKGGSIWNVMVTINGAVQAIGLALLVLFFVVGVVRTCGSFTDVKKPEHALKLFVRFAIAKGVITYGMELMLALFNIVQGIISTIMTSSGFGTPNQTTLPSEMVTTIEDCGFFESIPLWAVTLIGGLFITVLSFILIMTVYGRFFKLYMYTALAAIPLSTFAGEPNARLPSGISVPWVTRAPAPIMQFLPILAPFNTMAPMPMRVLSPTVQPWRMALCPTVTLSPTATG